MLPQHLPIPDDEEEDNNVDNNVQTPDSEEEDQANIFDDVHNEPDELGRNSIFLELSTF